MLSNKNYYCLFGMKQLAMTICFLCCVYMAQAQNNDLPANHVIKVAAPHLPKMERSNGGKVFYGEKHTYKLENKAALEKWMGQYPAEAVAYKAAITKLLNETDVNTLSDQEKELYYDLKSQWLMASQLIN